MEKKSLIYIFFGIIFSISILDILIPNKEFSQLENRKLISSVDFTVDKFVNGSFSKKYEEYVNDQFIGRDYWINLKSRSEYALGKLENNNVIYGDDGYLFEKFSLIDEKRINTNKEAIKTFVHNSNLKVSLMIVPNSYEIYNEKLPMEAPVIKQEEFIDEIYNDIENSNNISLVEVMKKNKNKYIYYKTDHHWTTYGAYLAYCEFIKSIGEIPVNIENMKEIEVNNFYGTYFSKAKPFNVKGDILSYYDIENISMDIGENKYNSLYDYSKLNIRDKYSAFLMGNNPLTIITNKENKNGKKLLVFKDSYANSLIPFLTYNYEEIHVIDLRTFNIKVSDYVKENDFEETLIIYNFINLSRDANIIKLKL